MELIFAGILGAVVGSFLSVCIYRIPLGRESGLSDTEDDFEKANSEHFKERVTIFSPSRSFCPSCGEQIPWYRNIPILSWLQMLGKSACCGNKISARYPFVELLSALFAFLSVWQFGVSPTAAVIYIYCCSMIVLSFIDIDYYLLPNVITYPFFFSGIVLAAINQFFPIFEPPLVSGLIEAFWGFMAGAGFLYIVAYGYLWLRKKQGLGLGDVKLLAMTGVFFGPEAAIYTIFIGSLFGSAIGIGLLLIGKGSLSRYLPFGPYLAVANLLYVFTDVWLMAKLIEGIQSVVAGGGAL